MNNIFFDLDGTLIESKPRLYQLFQQLVPSSKLSFDEYWAYKKSKTGHADILRKEFLYSQDQIEEFERDWLNKIELPEWLALDKPFDGVTDLLMRLKPKYKLYIVTARQSNEQALQQLKRFNWLNLVEKTLVTGQKKEKYDLIEKTVNLHYDDWFVGDTGKDIETGKKLGIRTAAVLSGFLSLESLLPYKPDIIAEDVTGLNFYK